MMINRNSHFPDTVKRRRRTEKLVAFLMLCGLPCILFFAALEAVESFPGQEDGCSSSNSSSNSLATVLLRHQQRKLQTLSTNLEIEPFQSSHGSLRTSDSGNIHETKSQHERNLPDWMTEYLVWHNETMKKLNEDHSQWKDYRYLVMRCLKGDHKCGGASDRLQSTPFALKLAARYQRLLFIEWEKPAPLTEFLVPVQINWIIPDWFYKTSSVHDTKHDGSPYMFFQRSPAILSDKHLHRLEEHKETIMFDMRYQTTDHGRGYYDDHLAENEPGFDQVYSQVWSSLFRPAPSVQKLIDESKVALGLESNSYNSLHMRSIYYKDKSHKQSRVEHAVYCAIQHLVPMAVYSDMSTPLFVASDSPNVTQTAERFGTERLGRRVVASSSSHPLHLDRGSNFLASSEETDWMEHPVSSYYDIFVDLYLLSGGQCVAYNNVGGYGRWASRIANHSCAIDLMKVRCDAPPPNQMQRKAKILGRAVVG